jgi:2'-5' RNA ligase
MSNQRLFIGCALPDHVKAWLDEAFPREAFEEARWVPRENHHITLKFLGSVPVETIEGVSDACARVASDHRAALVRLNGPGVFPKLGRAAVLWVGLVDEDGMLPRLAGDLDDALDPLGFERETRAFSPHVTVARFRNPQRIAALPSLPSDPPSFPVEAIELFRSRTGPGGSRYEVVARFPLTSGT